MTDWISVETRLPKKDVRVLVVISGKYNYQNPQIAAYSPYFDVNKTFFTDWIMDDCEYSTDFTVTPVTHWMPLPALPDSIKGV